MRNPYVIGSLIGDGITLNLLRNYYRKWSTTKLVYLLKIEISVNLKLNVIKNTFLYSR